jgi:hypothetical protein
MGAFPLVGVLDEQISPEIDVDEMDTLLIATIAASRSRLCIF